MKHSICKELSMCQPRRPFGAGGTAEEERRLLARLHDDASCLEVCAVCGRDRMVKVVGRESVKRIRIYLSKMTCSLAKPWLPI
jgi:hypothetical protein